MTGTPGGGWETQMDQGGRTDGDEGDGGGANPPILEGLSLEPQGGHMGPRPTRGDRQMATGRSNPPPNY